jgi:PAS domain S-box-containing protein
MNNNESDNNLRLLFDTMTSGFALHEIITDQNGAPVDYRFIDINTAFEKLTGLKRENILGKTVREILPGMEKDWIEKYGHVALTGETLHFENFSGDFNRHFDVVAYCPKPRHFAVVFNDITELRQINSNLRSERDLMKKLMEISPIGIAIIDTVGKIIFCNNRAAEILEVKTDEATQMYYNSVEWQHSDLEGNPISHTVLPFSLALNTKETVLNIQHAIFNTEGRRKYLSVSAAPMLDSKGDVISVITAFEDITDQYLNEKMIISSLKEKETLLKEIHHRVKNNFQIISSLINLQLSKSQTSRPEDLLLETKNRIRSMALVHEKLYRTESLSSIDFAEYLKTLIRDLEMNYRVEEFKPHIRFTLSPVFLDIERAIPCGLIANEIITNAFKYAFPAGFKGRPVIEIILQHNGHLMLTIKDNGIGFSESVDFESSKTLGLALIGMLIKQIGADLEFSGTNGASYMITIK